MILFWLAGWMFTLTLDLRLIRPVGWEDVVGAFLADLIMWPVVLGFIVADVIQCPDRLRPKAKDGEQKEKVE